MPGHLLVKDYLTPDTFDVAAKTMFAQRFLSRADMDFPPYTWQGQVYLEHLRVWNGFSEGEKQGWVRFVAEFANLLHEMRHGRFDWDRSPIPTRNGKLTNGRHRLAAALVLDQHIRTVEAEELCDCPAEFLQIRGLNSWMLDSMAIEYCRLKSETRIAVVYGPHDRSEIVDALAPAGRVFYQKAVSLTALGVQNLIHELYHEEEWLHVHGLTKANLSLANGGIVTFYGVDASRPHVLSECKAHIRLARNNHHVIHMNESHVETMRLARALFNDNGIHFLNHAHPRTYAHATPTRDARDVSIDSGGVLEVYGLRPASDIDFVDEDLHMEFHGVSLEALMYDPHNFFWSRGVKYASIPAVRRMKTNRGEAKDKQDLALMEGL